MADGVQVDVQALRQAAYALTELGNQMRDANTAADPHIREVVAPGRDPVSMAMAEIFRDHAARYLQCAAQGDETHEAMIRGLLQSANDFERAEEDNARSMSDA